MSTSSDSCSDYHHKLESSKLLPLFEELQAIGFPVSILERNLQKLKLGSVSICFVIYTHLYHTFQEFFLEKDSPLDQYILNGKVIDRESFARDFFSALHEIIGHEQALPLYQYVCPGHPLSKCEEIAKIAGKLRQVWRKRHRISVGKQCHLIDSIKVNVGEKSRQMDDRSTERLSATKPKQSDPPPHFSFTHPASSQKMYPARIETPDNIAWQAVRETGGGLSSAADDNDSGDLATSGDDEASPDEGIRSWNTSSIKKTPADFAEPDRAANGRSKHNQTTSDAMDSEDGLRTVLNRFEQIESQQNSRFRSIEEHLIRLERDLSDNNLKLHRSVIERLDNHERRISSLEQTTYTQARTSTRTRSIAEQGPSSSPTPQRAHEDRSAVDESPRKKLSDAEQRRRSIRSRSISRPLTGTLEKEHNLLHDSGFSSTHLTREHETPEPKPAKTDGNSTDVFDLKFGNSSAVFDSNSTAVFDSNAAQLESTKFSNYFESPREKVSIAGEVEARGSRKGSHFTQPAYRSSRSQSVAPANILATNCFDSASNSAAPPKPNDDIALLDLNERIQLRLKERIKTAEDTLNACMETIRKDYVLIRRQN